MTTAIILGLLALCGYLVYSLDRQSGRAQEDRRELMSRIDALTTSVARYNGRNLDLLPRPQIEKSDGWFDGKPEVTTKRSDQ